MAAPREHPVYPTQCPPAFDHAYSEGALPPRVPGFYLPAPPIPQPYAGAPARSPPAQRHQRTIPPSLIPGNQRHAPRPGAPTSNVHYNGQSIQQFAFPEPQVAPRLRHSVSTPHYRPERPPHTLYRSPSPQPVLPPKPSTYSHIPPRPTNSLSRIRSDESPKPVLPPKDFPSPEEADEDEALRRVLELSARESEIQRQRTLQQEEEDLAQAMQESLMLEQSHLSLPPLHTVNGIPPALPLVASPIDCPRTPSSELATAAHGLQSETVARPLIPPPLDLRDVTDHSLSVHDNSIAPGTASQFIDDDELARRLAEEDSFPDDESTGSHSNEGPSALPTFSPQSLPAPSSSSLLRSTSRTTLESDQMLVGSITRSTSANAVLRSQSTRSAVAKRDEDHNHPDISLSAAHADDNLSFNGNESRTDSDQASRAQTPPNDQYVDTDLLRGVQIGRGIPTITPSLEPMEGPMPSTISLPYGSQSPLYIRAPSWRGLLKLMASLSRTRLEPPVEAIAQAETDLKLRIVILFVKVHSTSHNWLTVLFMTIDHPVPATAQWKYRSGDTTTLPYSYTLSPPLAVLRDGADAVMSKFYTIPSTYTPYPQLPITFPSLASYLASALDDSRNAASHESSTGLRRLAKMIDAFYPLDSPKAEVIGRFGVRQRLKHFVGMGGKSRDRNAETYELVTPFVPDEFGR